VGRCYKYFEDCLNGPGSKIAQPSPAQPRNNLGTKAVLKEHIRNNKNFNTVLIALKHMIFILGVILFGQ